MSPRGQGFAGDTSVPPGHETESSERSLLIKEVPFIQEPSEVGLGAVGLQLGRCR